MPITHPIAAAARARGIPVLSELELGFLAAHAPLVCVTGTNGKSTTTDLIGALADRGRARGRGVRQHRPSDLRRRGARRPVRPARGRGLVVPARDRSTASSRSSPSGSTSRPTTSTATATSTRTARSRQRLFARQDEERLRGMERRRSRRSLARRAGAAASLEFSERGPVERGAHVAGGEIVLAWRGGRERLMPARKSGIPGPHNRMNALAALAATLPLEISPDTLARGAARLPRGSSTGSSRSRPSTA